MPQKLNWPTVKNPARNIPTYNQFRLVVAATAMIFVAYGDRELHLHMLVATGLGVFFTVLLGTGLMLLVFLSAESGHDDEVSRRKEDE